jgi:hypothetical protein
MVALGGRGGVASFFTPALDGVEWSASHSGRAIPPGKELCPPPPWYAMDKWLGQSHNRSKPSLPGSNPDVPVCSQTLQWLSCASLSRSCCQMLMTMLSRFDHCRCEQVFISMKNFRSGNGTRHTGERFESTLVENLLLVIILLFV